MSDREPDGAIGPASAASRRPRWLGLAIIAGLIASWVGGGLAGLALAGTALLIVGAAVLIGAIVIAGAADSRALQDARDRAMAGRTVEHITSARRFHAGAFTSDWGWLAVDAEHLTFTPKAATAGVQFPENLPVSIPRRAIVEIVRLPIPRPRGLQEILRILWTDPSAPVGASYLTTDLHITGLLTPWIALALSPDAGACAAVADRSTHVEPPRATARHVERQVATDRRDRE